MLSSPGNSSRDPLAQIAFLDSLEAKGMAESHSKYGYVEKVQAQDPAWLLADSIANDMGSDTTLFESRLQPEQEMLLQRAMAYFSVRERRQDFLDFTLFRAASMVRAPAVFHALMDAGANPLRVDKVDDPRPFRDHPFHTQGAMVEALVSGSPNATAAMLEKTTPRQTEQFVKQWLSDRDVAQWASVPDATRVQEPHPYLAQSLRQTTTPARGMLPKGMPDFLNLLEHKVGAGTTMDTIRQDVVLQYLRSCVHMGHGWHPDVLASLAGRALAPDTSVLAQLARKEAVDKQAAGRNHQAEGNAETLAHFALLAHCAPVLEVLQPLLTVHAKLPLDQHTMVRISTAIEQKTVCENFPFNAGQFAATLDVMLEQGHAFVIDYEFEGRRSRYSALHDLAGHNGKNTFPHRMEKLLGLLNAGADPTTRNLSNQLSGSMVKPVGERHQWQAVIHARRARVVAHDVLKEIEGLAP